MIFNLHFVSSPLCVISRIVVHCIDQSTILQVWCFQQLQPRNKNDKNSLLLKPYSRSLHSCENPVLSVISLSFKSQLSFDLRIPMSLFIPRYIVISLIMLENRANIFHFLSLVSHANVVIDQLYTYIYYIHRDRLSPSKMGKEFFKMVYSNSREIDSRESRTKRY